MLRLNEKQLNALDSILYELELKNGSEMYNVGTITCSYSCDKWDCFISCHCANSRD